MAEKLSTRNARRGALTLIVGMALALGIGAIAVFLYENGIEENEHFAAALRANQVAMCEPFKAHSVKVERKLIHNTAKTRTSYFPNIPPAVLHRLIRAEVEAAHAGIAELEAINCEAVPPTP